MYSIFWSGGPSEERRCNYTVSTAVELAAIAAPGGFGSCFGPKESCLNAWLKSHTSQPKGF